MVRRVSIAIVLLVGLAVAGCKKKPAPAGGEACVEDAAAIACVPGGVGPEGSPCKGESWDCEGNTLVQCVSGVYRHFECGGAGGCARKETGVACDSTIARLGAPCNKAGTLGCSADHKERYACRGGVFALERRCSGPRGCVVSPGGDDRYAVDCDTSLGSVGDPCTDPGGTCSLDRRSLLTCDGRKLVLSSVCRGGKPECGIAEGIVQCAEPGVAEVGDPCQSGSACAGDGKAFLACKAGAFAFAKKCRACKVVGTDILCTP